MLKNYLIELPSNTIVYIKRSNAIKCPFGWRGEVEKLIKSIPKYILNSMYYDVDYDYYNKCIVIDPT